MFLNLPSCNSGFWHCCECGDFHYEAFYVHSWPTLGDEVSESEQRWKCGMWGSKRELSIVGGRNVTVIEYLKSLWLKRGRRW
jgi:hypothetical protein